MGKLTNLVGEGGEASAIGDLALLDFIDELNDRRARNHNSERYHPVRDKTTGRLCMATHRLPSRMERDTASQCYAALGPEAAVRAGYPKDPPWRPAMGEIEQIVGRFGRQSATR